MPTAPPSSRTVSLSAEATPCFSGGSDSVIAVVDGLMHEADADGRRSSRPGRTDQVAAVGRHHRRQQGEADAEQADADEHVVRVPTRLAIVGRHRRQRHHHDRHRQQAGGGMQRRVAEHGLQELRRAPGRCRTSRRTRSSSVTEPAARPRLREQPDLEQRVRRGAAPRRRSRPARATPTTRPAIVSAVGPAPLGAFVDAEHEAADGQRREHRADDVEAARRGPRGSCRRPAAS